MSAILKCGCSLCVERAHARIAELEALITDAIPFIGYEAYVPDLVRRAEETVQYGQPGKGGKG